MFRVSSSSSGLAVETYLGVPRGCPTIRQAMRSLSAYFSRAASTACRRRSGLTSFPVQYPAGPVSQATGRPPASSACRSCSQGASGVWPDPFQGRHTLSASGSSFVPSSRLPFRPWQSSCPVLAAPPSGVASLQSAQHQVFSVPSSFSFPVSSSSEKAGQVNSGTFNARRRLNSCVNSAKRVRKTRLWRAKFAADSFRLRMASIILVFIP